MSLSAKVYRQLFTDAEWDTISAALDDYLCYDDPDADEEELIGGVSVSDRVNSIQQKINTIFQQS